MREAQRIELRASLDVRVRHILSEFSGLIEDRAALEDIIRGLAPYHSGDVISGWLHLSSRGEFDRLVRDLMLQHYDPRYRKHRERNPKEPAITVGLPDTAPERLASMAGHIASAVGLT